MTRLEFITQQTEIFENFSAVVGLKNGKIVELITIQLWLMGSIGTAKSEDIKVEAMNLYVDNIREMVLCLFDGNKEKAQEAINIIITSMSIL